jgi:hypothetical protein
MLRCRRKRAESASTRPRTCERGSPQFPGFFLNYPSRRQLPAALSALIDTLRLGPTRRLKRDQKERYVGLRFNARCYRCCPGRCPMPSQGAFLSGLSRGRAQQRQLIVLPVMAFASWGPALGALLS